MTRNPSERVGALADSRARRIDELPATRWRNGLGLTRTVAHADCGVEVDGDGGEPPWRISVATVTDGSEFSAFAGYRRVFVPLGGDPVSLVSHVGHVSGDRELPTEADGTVTFDGAIAVRARVVGDTAVALNVMTRAGFRAEVGRLEGTGGPSGAHPHSRAIIVTQGVVTDGAGRAVPAPAVVTPGRSVFSEGARLLDVRIIPEWPVTDRTIA